MHTLDYPFARTELLIGADALERLRRAHVVVFGVGGVGSFAAEALTRSGVGTLTLVDHDVIAPSNINRQLHALHSTVGRYKTDVMRERLLDINPDADIRMQPLFYTGDEPLPWDFDFAVDAVDTVAAKLRIVLEAQKRGIPVVSAMGAGNKLDASLFRIADIYETRVCPLAKIMRHLCRKHGVTSLKVVYSTEKPLTPGMQAESEMEICAEPSVLPRKTIGSIAYVTATAGLLLAGEVIKGLIEKHCANESVVLK